MSRSGEPPGAWHRDPGRLRRPESLWNALHDGYGLVYEGAASGQFITPLATQFVASFRRAIEAEVALRQDSSAYEVPLEVGRALSEMTQGELTYYAFQLVRPSERVTPGVKSQLARAERTRSLPWPLQAIGNEVVLRARSA